MSVSKVAVPPHTAPEVDCPALDPVAEAQLASCIHESKQFSVAVLKFLGRLDRDEQSAWIGRSVGAGRVLFQPWAMEILFVLATMGKLRFTEMQNTLGISSRTLSDKLQVLREAELIDRTVYDEQPVRIEYELTKNGRGTAALATPLFAHLNRRA